MKLESGVFVNTERCRRTHRKLSTKSLAQVKSSKAFIPAVQALMCVRKLAQKIYFFLGSRQSKWAE